MFNAAGGVKEHENAEPRKAQPADFFPDLPRAEGAGVDAFVRAMKEKYGARDRRDAPEEMEEPET